MIKAHKQKDHGVHLINSISKGGLHCWYHLCGRYRPRAFQIRQHETAEEAHEKLQEGIRNWGCLLIATGGALKPIKCFYQLISFSWNPNGTQRYEQNENREDFKIVVPLEDGTFSRIEISILIPLQRR
jgi:hypothetical protein